MRDIQLNQTRAIVEHICEVCGGTGYLEIIEIYLFEGCEIPKRLRHIRTADYVSCGENVNDTGAVSVCSTVDLYRDLVPTKARPD